MDKPIALVTGASRGIGRAIALQLAEDGFAVVVNYRSGREAAESVAEAIGAAGGVAHLRGFDVADREATEADVRALSKELGKISVLVNNAGITRDQALVRMRDEDWDGVVSTNLTGVYNCTKAVVRTWAGRNRGDRIINITSVVGEMGNPFQSNYCATKAGVIGFTKALAKELGGKKITVNAVAPGFIETDMTSELDADSYVDQVPLKRAGQAEDVARCVSFLASPHASYITGQVIRVDGGLLM